MSSSSYPAQEKRSDPCWFATAAAADSGDAFSTAASASDSPLPCFGVFGVQVARMTAQIVPQTAECMASTQLSRKSTGFSIQIVEQ